MRTSSQYSSPPSRWWRPYPKRIHWRRAAAPTLMDFDRQPFVMYSPIEARYFHDLVTAAFSRSGVIPRYTQCTSQIHSILALVRGGLGTALAPEAPMSLRFDGVVCRPLRRAHSAPAVELYMAWKKEDDNPARRSVLDTCLQHCQSAALTRTRRWPQDGAPAPAARI
jgi:DNA-binding transcriptional LysR family regulator